MNPAATEAAGRADFSDIRYAQVWEDADLLPAALRLRPGAVCLSIASAGDNALALLSHDPGKVYALDLNPAQLHCLALRVAAFKVLDHAELLVLVGSRSGPDRVAFYRRCRPLLDDDARRFWDARPEAIAAGIGSAGRFERYFALFRRRALPLVHRRATIKALLQSRPPEDRLAFFQQHWNTWRWRALFRIFFSRFVMGRLGRDPAFFKYVEGSVASRILDRARYALTELDPAGNPYLHWILTGHHGDALPCYLRPENFETIRRNLDRLEWRLATVEAFAASFPERGIDAFNLSDIFEYMSEANTESLFRTLLAVARPGARLAYWNMLAPRSRPASLAADIEPRPEEAERLFRKDRAFFYSRFVVEEVVR
ncbi:MAG: DUF3419 family protein [Puniceicoccaceae bacterium]|nr:MAG: DUF3419 family protein [Puniceicoccaceae bacterium]